MPSDTGGCRVERVAEREIRRKARRELGHLRADAIGHGERVRAWRLEDRNRAAGLAVRAADLLVVQCAELDARDVAKPDDRAVGIRPDGNRAELLFGLEASLRADGVGHVLTERRGIRADLAGGIDRALLQDGGAQIGNRETQPRQQVGLDPDAHGVVAGSEDARFADARHAIERIEDVDVRVVGKEQRVVGLVGRRQRHDQHRESGGLPHGEAERADVRRQVRLRLRQAILHVDLIEVGHRVDVEGDGQRHRSVVRVRRLHVEHVVDAVHRLFERRGDRVLDCQRVGARIRCRHENLRWHDGRELGDRQPAQGHQAAEHGDDGDDDGDDGAADEEG